jgi:hypothetical protein
VIGGGALGTVFDVTVLAESGNYRRWGSWRPKHSLALFESTDGIHWSPEIVLPPRPETTWEDDVNRPTALRRPDGYHMWYTGQARGQSWIGYSTSPDGRSWTRRSDRPVVSPELPWEKHALAAASRQSNHSSQPGWFRRRCLLQAVHDLRWEAVAALVQRQAR